MKSGFRGPGCKKKKELPPAFSIVEILLEKYEKQDQDLSDFCQGQRFEHVRTPTATHI